MKRDGKGILARTINRVSSSGTYDQDAPSEEGFNERQANGIIGAMMAAGRKEGEQ